MEMINTAPSAAQQPNIARAHAMQKNRQAYLGLLKRKIENKMNAMRQEADSGVESDQPLQRWFAEQVFESANHLSLQFTESVVGHTWEKI